jgi:hypothetical protein
MSISEHPYLQSTAAVYSQNVLSPGLEVFRGLHCHRIWHLLALGGGGGFWKQKVLFHRQQDIEGLKARIRQEVLRGVMDIFRTDCSSALQTRVCAYGHNF